MYTPTKCSGAAFGILRMKNKSYDTNYKIKLNLMESASGKADRGMSQVSFY